MEPTTFLLLQIAPKLVRTTVMSILVPRDTRPWWSAVIPSFLVQFWTLDPRVLVQNSDGTKRAAPYGNVTVMEHLSCYNPTSNLGAAQKNRHFDMGAHHQRVWNGFRTTKVANSRVGCERKNSCPDLLNRLHHATMGSKQSPNTIPH